MIVQVGHNLWVDPDRVLVVREDPYVDDRSVVRLRVDKRNEPTDWFSDWTVSKVVAALAKGDAVYDHVSEDE